MKRIVSGIMLTILLIGMLTLALNVQPVRAEPRTWIVDDDGPADFHTIRDAVGNASSDDTICVAPGVYKEGLLDITKSLKLTGQCASSTVIEGFIHMGAPFDRVCVNGFSIGVNPPCFESGGCIWDAGPLFVWGNNGVMTNNILLNSGLWNLDQGLRSVVVAGSGWLISNNSILDPYLWDTGGFVGIEIIGSNCTVTRNQIGNHTLPSRWAGIVTRFGTGNRFVGNTVFNIFPDGPCRACDGNNTWNDVYPLGGNFWSDYTGVDLYSGPYQNETGSDGLGDTPYIINADNVDNYPLMNPYGAPPLQTYNLTITTTVGGTTEPSVGIHSYTANLTVQVRVIPEGNYLFDYWELDSVNIGPANPCTVLMDKNHTLKAVFSPIPPPLSASISPLSASINVGQSVTFTSTLSGGHTPYSYQWYLNGKSVSGATSNTWAFTPATSGIYYVYLKVTDAKSNTAQSETARIAVTAVPVGGYSFPIQVQTKTEPIIPYIALIATLTAILTKLKPKTKRKR